LIGFILGNLDSDLRQFFGQAVAVMVPFFAFALGNNLDFRVILDTGLLGVLIGICVILVTGTTLVLADIFLARGNGTAGIGAASTAGAAVAVPQIIAGIEPRYAAVAPAATALVATSVVVTSLLTPILTAIWARRWGVLSASYRRKHPASAEPLSGSRESRHNHDDLDNHGLEPTLHHPLK
jgi:2-keto-3-deoxygluconate permease